MLAWGTVFRSAVLLSANWKNHGQDLDAQYDPPRDGRHPRFRRRIFRSRGKFLGYEPQVSFEGRPGADPLKW